MKDEKHPYELADSRDYIHVLVAIMNQAIDDYIKLSHPTNRDKKYLAEAYLTAVDFLFDPEYRVPIKNDWNDDMSTRDLVSTIMDTDSPDIEALQSYSVKECYSYWSNKVMAILDHIPDSICIGGQQFAIKHSNSLPGYAIDWPNKTILLDKRHSKAAEINLLEASIDIIARKGDLPRIDDSIKPLAEQLYFLLKTNNFFSYIGVPKEEVLFQDHELVKEAREALENTDEE